MGIIHDDVLVNTDALCEIDIYTRKITRKSKKGDLIQNDHNSERIGFTMERYIDGHDMAIADRVAIKYLNGRHADTYIVDDVAVSDDKKYITFTWLVSGNATQEVGSLAFLINFRCWNDEGVITYNWSTQPCSTYSILRGVTSMDSNPNEQYDFWAKYEGLVNEVADKTRETSDRVAVISQNLEDAETKSKDLILICDDLGHEIMDLSKEVPVLENKVGTIEDVLPDLESRVITLERSLDDDAVQAISKAVTDIEMSIANNGKINYDLIYRTTGSGVVYDYPDHTRLILTEMLDCSQHIRIENTSTDYVFGVIYYEDDKTWSNADTGWQNIRELSLRDYGYAYVNFKKVDETAFTDDEIPLLKAAVSIYKEDYDFAKSSELDNTDYLVDKLIEPCEFKDFKLAVGTINAGIPQPGAAFRCYTTEYIRVRKGMYIQIDSKDYYYGVACFDENKVYDGVDSGWIQRVFYINFDGYILMNFRTSTDELITDTHIEDIKKYVSIKNYVKYDDMFVEDIENIVDEHIDDCVEKHRTDNERNVAINSISVEYGRYDGASYVFCRIPKTLNDGRTIMPKVRLTSADGSLTGSKRSTLTYARETNGIFTVNAGLFDMTKYVPVGQTIIDGVSITNTPMKDDNGSPISDTECYPLCIDANGTLSAPYPRSVDTGTMLIDGIVQAITGWGKIVDNFEITLDDIKAEIVHQGKYIRQSIGQYQNGDYAVCTVDQSRGNVKNEAGITYEALAQIFVDHGVKFAYSLDGGGSAETVIGKRQLNPIYEGTAGRPVPTVISFEVVE